MSSLIGMIARRAPSPATTGRVVAAVSGGYRVRVGSGKYFVARSAVPLAVGEHVFMNKTSAGVSFISGTAGVESKPDRKEVIVNV